MEVVPLASTRPPGHQGATVCFPGAGGIDDGGNIDGESGAEGQQSRKAELEEKLKELSRRPDIYEPLAQLLAPVMGDGPTCF